MLDDLWLGREFLAGKSLKEFIARKAATLSSSFLFSVSLSFVISLFFSFVLSLFFRSVTFFIFSAIRNGARRSREEPGRAEEASTWVHTVNEIFWDAPLRHLFFRHLFFGTSKAPLISNSFFFLIRPGPWVALLETRTRHPHVPSWITRDPGPTPRSRMSNECFVGSSRKPREEPKGRPGRPRRGKRAGGSLACPLSSWPFFWLWVPWPA